MTLLHTARLRLEPITEAHLDGLHDMNRREEVMRYVSGQPETREQTVASIARIQRCWAAWGTGWWAWIDVASGRVAGAGCVQRARRDAELPADLTRLRDHPLELGWRLHPDYWGQGLASEAARCMAADAFERFAPAELIAVRDVDNLASARVMDRLGMRFRGIETWYGMPLATHVLARADALAG